MEPTRPPSVITCRRCARLIRRGASFRLLELLRAARFEIAMSVPLALEYEASYPWR